MNAFYQFPAMIEYAKQHRLLTDDPSKRQDLDEIARNCQLRIGSDSIPDDDTFEYCALIENSLLSDDTVRTRPFNYYDIRVECGPHDECYDFTQLDRLLDDSDVIRSLGVFQRTPKPVRSGGGTGRR